MTRQRLILFFASILFLAGAFFSGSAVSSQTMVNTFHHVEAIGSGVDRLRHFMASALFLQLDDYHHIEMYQGVSWTEVTDYLPQMWIIARLDPTFTDVYTDAAYHLAVNLGEVDRGIEFIREGLANNPDSLDVVYEYAYLMWQTGRGSSEEVTEACLNYLTLVRRSGGDAYQQYNEPSSSLILAEVLADETDTLNAGSEFYRNRSRFIRDAMHAGLYYPGYLEEPPAFLSPLETEPAQ